MKLHQLLAINAILFVGLGIAFALYAPLMLAIYGIQESGGDAGTYWFAASFARLFGAALFGFGFSLWALQRSVQSGAAPVRRGVLLGLILSYGLGAVVAITQQVSVWGNAAGWITTGVFLLLLCGYIYFSLQNER